MRLTAERRAAVRGAEAVGNPFLAARPHLISEHDRDRKALAQRLPTEAEPMPPAAQGCTELREHLARELHDSIAGELQAMLIDMELLRRRQPVPAEIEAFQTTIRRALAGLRGVLRELRDLPPDPALVETAIDRKMAGAKERRHPREPAT